MKTAIIITGELRFKGRVHFNRFCRLIKGYDVFLCTYPDYEPLAQKITKKYILLPRSAGGIRGKMQTNIFQWLHLDNLLKEYLPELEQYDNILKLRTDIAFTRGWVNEAHKLRNSFTVKGNSVITHYLQSLEKNTLYATSDILFYASSSHFIKTFKDFYSDIYGKYWRKCINYYPLNFDSILKSECGNFHLGALVGDIKGVRFNWLVLPSFIIDEIGCPCHPPESGPFREWLHDSFTSTKPTESPSPPHLRVRDCPQLLVNFPLFKAVIQRNYDYLINLNSNYADADIEFVQPRIPLRERCKQNPERFASEQIFAVNAFEHGVVKNSAIPLTQLAPMRHKFSFK